MSTTNQNQPQQDQQRNKPTATTQQQPQAKEQDNQQKQTTEREADPNRKTTLTPTATPATEQDKTTAAGKTPTGGSESLEDENDNIAPDEQAKNTTNVKVPDDINQKRDARDKGRAA